MKAKKEKEIDYFHYLFFFNHIFYGISMPLTRKETGDPDEV